MQNLEELWHQTLGKLQESVYGPSFDAWLKETRAHSINENTITIEVANDYQKDWLQNHYLTVITDTLYEITGNEMEIVLISKQEMAEEAKQTEMPKTEKKTQQPTNMVPTETNNMLNPRYTFDSFVIGSGNRFAHAASLAVAEQPAKAYNPLFLYGGVGLGKTHLMHAIGHYVLAHNPTANVAYVTSETFLNEYINSIQFNKGETFRNKYRSFDVLLIDDIQFLGGKEGVQEEFFHTFNTLHNENKQIIISSDRPPKEIPTLEDRLRSRFEWGLITDITPPNLETRIAILRKKAKADGSDIPDEVMLYIANQIDSNIRELEGALTRVVAYSSLNNEDITASLAAEALKNIIPNAKPKMLGIKDIQKAVADVFGVKIEDFKTKKRTQAIAFPRQVAMYLSRELTDYALLKIGDEFGGRDHTTVIHAHEKISKLLTTDEKLTRQIKEVKELLTK